MNERSGDPEREMEATDGGAPERARAGLAGGTHGGSADDSSSREAGERSRRTHHTDGGAPERAGLAGGTHGGSADDSSSREAGERSRRTHHTDGSPERNVTPGARESSPPTPRRSVENAGLAAESGEPPAGALRVDTAEADELFCRIAVRSGLLDPIRGDELMALVRGQPPGAAAAFCLARGWLNDSQARALQASVEATAGASPDVVGEGSRAFGRLVEMKRLAEDGRVDACRTIQVELSGTPYARLGELLIQRAQRRAGGPPRKGIRNRQEAFDTYVRLKQAVQRGAVDEAARLATALDGDPEFGRLAQVQLERARVRRSISDARKIDDAPVGVTPCPACGTSTRVGEPCPRCAGEVSNSRKPHNDHP